MTTNNEIKINALKNRINVLESRGPQGKQSLLTAHCTSRKHRAKKLFLQKKTGNNEKYRRLLNGLRMTARTEIYREYLFR